MAVIFPDVTKTRIVESLPVCTVLLSGGIDSAACVELFQKKGFKVVGIHISYGQPAQTQELVATRSISDHYGIFCKYISLTGGGKKDAGEISGRNAFLIAAGVLELDANSNLLAIGIHAGSPYYDCTGSFIFEQQRVLDGYFNGKVQLVAPFLAWTKKDIIDYCQTCSVPIAVTYSCERGAIPPCGDCLSCLDREALGVG